MSRRLVVFVLELANEIRIGRPRRRRNSFRFPAQSQLLEQRQLLSASELVIYDGINVLGKGITILDGDMTPSAIDDTYFGMIAPNAVARHAFTVKNQGTSTLYLGSPSLGPGMGFRFGSDALVTRLEPGQSDTFNVEMISATPGTYTRQITIYNNDADESPYNFAIKGYVGVPEIDITGKGVSIVDGDTTPSTADDTDFGSFPVNTTLTRTFTVKNTGTGTLYLGTPSVVGTGFRRGPKVLKSYLDPGQSDTFDVLFSSASFGTFSGEVILYSNDSNESPYNFTLKATATAPEIDVTGKGLSIVDGDSTPSTIDGTDFGIVNVETTVTRIFTVVNTGTGWLYLGTPSLPVGFTRGPDSLMTSLGPGSSDTFSVQFSPTVVSTVSGQISINNSDADESPYNFAISAEGGIPEIDVQGYDIEGHKESIANNDFTPDIADGTDFGTVPPGTIVTRLFTVENQGSGWLYLGTPVVTGAAFRLVSNYLVSPLSPHTSASFVVQFLSSVAGPLTGQISIGNSDSDESTYKFAVLATAGVPEIEVSGNNVKIPDGNPTVKVTDFTDFGTVLAGETVTKTFKVENTGNAILTLNAPTFTTGLFKLGSNTLVSQLAPGYSDTFTVDFSGPSKNIYSSQINIGNNDSDENPYNFKIQAEVTEPEIDVQGNSKSIADGDGSPSLEDWTDFGAVVIGGTISRTFTVFNTGNGPLKPGAITLPTGFTIGSDTLASSIAAGASDTFQVVFSSATVRTSTGDISFANNDLNENPYNFTITARAGFQIKGTIKYDTTNPKPVRGALVRAWENDGLLFDTLLGETFTDDNGDYTITTTTAASSVYVRVYAETAPAGVGPGHVKRAVVVEAPSFDPIQAGFDYYREFIPAPRSINNSTPILVASDLFSNPAETVVDYQAFWAYDAAVTASRFHATLPGVPVGTYEIQFPNPFEPVATGSAGYGENIYLHSTDWQKWDVVIHEYGHLVAGTAGFFALTGSPLGWNHSLGVNARIKNPYADYYDDMQLGFNEGWADFYSVVAQELEGVSSPPVNRNPYFSKDMQYAGYNAESTEGNGEDEELSVMAILWDLYDTPNDTGDSFAMGIDTLFTLLSTKNPLTLDELWDALLIQFPAMNDQLALGTLFETHHVSPKLVGAAGSGSTSPPSKSITIRKFDPPPMFSWNIPVGNGAQPPATNPQLLNRFGIRIFDSTNAIVFDSGYLKEGTAQGAVQISGNVATYFPSFSDWQSKVAVGVGTVNATFRYIVYGGYFGDETLQSNIQTGDYWSSPGQIVVQP